MKCTFLITLTALCLLTSCKDYPCERAESQLAFIGFSADETDTVIVRQFASLEDVALVDTFLLTKDNSSFQSFGDTLMVSNAYGTMNGLLSDYDYEILLPSARDTFWITNITEQMNSMRTGLFSTDKVACVNSISSYEVNGQRFNSLYNYMAFYIKK